MNITFLEMLPLDISKKIMAIAIQNLKEELINETTEGLCYRIYQRIDGIQSRVYDLYSDKKDIIYYLEKLKQLDAITVYIRTIITEWLARVRYSRVRYILYDDRLPQSQSHKNDMNDLLMIRNYI